MILSLKELFVKDITNELFAYYKEQIMNLYNQLSYCNNVSNLYHHLSNHVSFRS